MEQLRTTFMKFPGQERSIFNTSCKHDVEVRFDGGHATGNGGVPLPRPVDQRLGLLEATGFRTGASQARCATVAIRGGQEPPA